MKLKINSHPDLEPLLNSERQISFEKGISHGISIGLEQAQSELQSLILLLKKITNSLIDKTISGVKALNQELAELTIKISTSVIRQELQNPMTVFTLINNVLNSAIQEMSSQNITIFISEHSFNLISILLHENNMLHSVTWKISHDAPVHGCRIETSLNIINYDIENELNEIYNRLLI